MFGTVPAGHGRQAAELRAPLVGLYVLPKQVTHPDEPAYVPGLQRMQAELEEDPVNGFK